MIIRDVREAALTHNPNEATAEVTKVFNDQPFNDGWTLTINDARKIEDRFILKNDDDYEI